MQTLLHKLATGALAGEALTPALAGDIFPQLLHKLPELMAIASLATSSHNKATISCGIINAKSGRCAENCAFCAQSAHYQTSSPVYPLKSTDELLARAEALAKSGAQYMGIVTSGTAPTAADMDSICRSAEKIRQRVDIKLCASLGILTPDKATALVQAGFSSCHHNLESARSFYPEICSTHDFEVRVNTVKVARTAGLRVCSGGIFGLGESWQQRLELAFTLKELGVDSIPANFLTPISGTPLGSRTALPVREALMVIAMLRLILPAQDIIICGGREATFGPFQALVLNAGANGIMVGDYLTTAGSSAGFDSALLEVLGYSYE